MSLEPTEVVYLSAADERANTWTHGAGFVLSLVAVAALAMHPADPPPALVASCWAFAISLAAVYFCSTMSHAVQDPYRRHRWRAWDQGMIYALISGTYTPFVWAFAPDRLRIPMLVAIWVAAAAGFYSKVFAMHRVSGISTVTYVLLGWLPAVPLAARTPTVCLWWMFLGGVAYTAGIGFLTRDTRYRYFHALWHLMVMIGSACHFVAIYHLIEIVS